MTEIPAGRLSASDFFADSIGPHNREEVQKRTRSLHQWLFFTEKIRPILDRLKGEYVAFNGLKQTLIYDPSKQYITSILEQEPNKEDYLMIKVTVEGEVMVPIGTIEYWASREKQLAGES